MELVIIASDVDGAEYGQREPPNRFPRSIYPVIEPLLIPAYLDTHRGSVIESDAGLEQPVSDVPRSGKSGIAMRIESGDEVERNRHLIEMPDCCLEIGPVGSGERNILERRLGIDILGVVLGRAFLRTVKRYAAALDRACTRIAHAAPDVVVVSLGVDVFDGHGWERFDRGEIEPPQPEKQG